MANVVMKSKRKSSQKLYVIRKYILAPSVALALRKEKKAPVDDIWVDDEWKKGNASTLADAVGFQVQSEEDMA